MLGRLAFPRGSLLARHRDFRRYWMGQTLSVFGTQITAVALPLVAVLSLHAGAEAVGAIAAATYLPNAVLPLFVGNWLDGRQLRPVMILADVIRAAALLLVPLAYLNHFLALQLLVGWPSWSVPRAWSSISAASRSFPAWSRTRISVVQQAIQGSMTMAEVAGPGLPGCSRR